MLLGGINVLSIKEILEISNEMDVEIRNSTDGKHYILDDHGKEVEFSPDMLMTIDEESISYKVNVQISTDSHIGKFASDYNLSSCETLYVSKSVSINESIIDAA